jgi:hypothetical protein
MENQPTGISFGGGGTVTKLSKSDERKLNRMVSSQQSLDREYGGQKRNWLSIKRRSRCLFSRRNGHRGKLFLGFSICLRLFGKTILAILLALTVQGQVLIEDIGKSGNPTEWLTLQYKGYMNYRWVNEYGEIKRITADTIYTVPNTPYIIAKLDTSLYVLGFSMYADGKRNSQSFQRQVKNRELLLAELRRHWKMKEDNIKKHQHR